jgi:hypothetical protein
VATGWHLPSPPAPELTLHGAIDFGSRSDAAVSQALLGQAVSAPCTGFAMASTRYDAGKGYGRFVLLRCDEKEMATGRHFFVVLAQLASIEASLPTFVDRFAGADACPSAADDTTCAASWAAVTEGDPLGTAGDDDSDFVNLHVEVYLGDYREKGGHRVDPYDIWGTSSSASAEHVYNASDPLFAGCGENHLWKTCPPQPGDPCAGKTCSGHGTCSGGVCTCDIGFYAPDCSWPCPTNFCTQQQVTSGDYCADLKTLNTCSVKGSCVIVTSTQCTVGQGCLPGTNQCDKACPNDCSGHGACYAGYCGCSPGWTGLDCSTPA